MKNNNRKSKAAKK